MKQKMICPRCQNTDPQLFYHGSRGWYCRRCISFGVTIVEEELESVSVQQIREKSEEYILEYPLTEKQKEIGIAASQMIEKKNVLIQAVCGAGKTEMVVPLIANALKQRKKICFAIARRQVVLELQERLSKYFPHARVIAVCGGHTSVLDGDLIICTTHQLFRYHQTFDVLILDEPDAFPYRGNEVLHQIALGSCRGKMVYLTATPDAYLKQEIQEGRLYCFRLHERPHGKPIPVPTIAVRPKWWMYLSLIRWLKVHEVHPRIVFVPTIAMAIRMQKILSIRMACSCVTSKSDHRDEIIQKFKDEGKGVLIATTVLERGVTIKDVDVCVFLANHSVFDEAGLIQMAGRAGRNFLNPYGDVLFLCDRVSEKTRNCQRQLEEDNHAMSSMS